MVLSGNNPQTLQLCPRQVCCESDRSRCASAPGWLPMTAAFFQPCSPQEDGPGPLNILPPILSLCSLKISRHLSGHIQDQEHARHPGACGALTDLQRGTQGECVLAECLSRNVIVYRLKYVHRGLYLSRNEKKAAFSFYSSPTI